MNNKFFKTPLRKQKWYGQVSNTEKNFDLIPLTSKQSMKSSRITSCFIGLRVWLASLLHISHADLFNC